MGGGRRETVRIALESTTLDDARLVPVRVGLVAESRGKILEENQVCLLLVVHGVHSGSSLVIGREADETETAAAAGITVLDDGLGKENRSLRRLWEISYGSQRDSQHPRQRRIPRSAGADCCRLCSRKDR